MIKSVGQIGLGKVGQHLCGHLLRGFGSLTVFDADPERMSAKIGPGVTVASSVGDLGARCDAVVLSLPSPTAVRDVMLGDAGLLATAQPNSLVIDLSTIDPESCRTMHRAAKERRVSYIEAPISGGEPDGPGAEGAKAGTISFMVGGDAEAFERARPVLDAMGRFSFHLGPAGAGSTVKLISNHIAGLNNLVVAEAFALGAAAGFSPETLLTVFEHTDAKSYMMHEYCAPRIRNRDFDPGFSVDLMHKDHRLAGELAQRLKVPLLFNQIALEAYQMMRAQGMGQRDLADAVNFMAQLAGVDVYAPRAPQAD